MTMNNQDQATRAQALNPAESFIVQAPAGSGKTELLTQRFLRLLTCVDAPEEIIAITFTRKAAAEMRTRITSALACASEQTKPTEPYKAATWQLAHKALIQDQKLKWHLQDNPNRLRILTIDALSASICAQIPLLSRFGGQANISEDARPYYQEAAQTLLLSNKHNDKIETLLLHLDNNASQLASLLTEILAYREQWLPHLTAHYQNPDSLRASLEKGLATIATEKMSAVQALMNDDTLNNLASCAQFAGQYLTEQHSESFITNCADLQRPPGIELNDFPAWLGIARLLLTKENQWRKKIDKCCGFPTEKKHQGIKEQFKNLLAALKDNDALKTALGDILLCPPVNYTEQQWEITDALINLLPQLAAELHVIFMQRGVIDFIELTLGALRALGNAAQPTDLALHLDYRIRHLLIDEFQDTSVIQFFLIEQLLSGWQANDGRTLFLVGDPMQSIYRFRNAEVGLFLRAQQQGLANVPLKTLTLKTNFRAHKNIVAWINTVFKTILPTLSDVTLGAVPYSPAMAMRESEEKSVHHYPVLNATPANEAQYMVDIINGYQQQNPQATIAILVRSRAQLIDIIPVLRAAKLRFQAIDIEPLAHRMEIQDLLSLTRALFYLHDRIAWLAILRAPWCGLTLKDLHTLTQYGGEKPIWSSLLKFADIKNLSPDGKKRLQRVVPVLAKSIKNHNGLPLSAWIEGTWLALGGPAAMNTLSASDNVKAYFKLLEKIEDDFSLELLENKLQQLYADTTPQEQVNLQIMTIHKAKGLEFDHVILPGLQRKTPAAKSRLLLWLDRPVLQGGSDLILAPIRAANIKQDGIYSYLQTVERTKLDHEMARLLYVAVTRAKSTLHLISAIEQREDDSEQLRPPKKGSFLNLLWEPCITEINHYVTPLKNTTLKPATNHNHQLTRVIQDWQLPTIPTTMAQHINNPKTAINPSIQQKQQSYLGIVIHEILEKIATDGVAQWDGARINAIKYHWQRRLKQLGTLPKYLDCYSTLTVQAINNILNDPTGRWLFSPTHQDAGAERAITVIKDNQPVQYVIDRTFIDNNNIRWVVDYKTAFPLEEPLAEFLAAQKELHRAQLHQYAELFKNIDTRHIKLGLYFPLCAAWCEWDYPCSPVKSPVG